jgi:hypothetical protein
VLEYLAPFLAMVVLLLVLDLAATRWGAVSLREFGDRNW